MRSSRWLALCCLLAALLAYVLLGTAVPAAAADDDGDLYEIGTVSQDNYGDQFDPSKCCCMLYGKDEWGNKTYHDATWSAFCSGFVSRMAQLSPGYHQPAPFPLKEANAHASDITRQDQQQGGLNRGDQMDVFIWTGHSYSLGKKSKGGNPLPEPHEGPGPSGERDNGAALHFIADHTGNPTSPPDECCYRLDETNVNHMEMRLGAVDCEVGIFVTCEFLRNYNNLELAYEIRHMLNGAHIILGFATPAYFLDYAHETTFGRKLAEPLMGIRGTRDPATVIASWEEACVLSQAPIIPLDADEPYVVARAVYWTRDCASDHLLGNWRNLLGQPGWGMGAPPPPCVPGNESEFSETTKWIYPPQ